MARKIQRTQSMPKGELERTLFAWVGSTIMSAKQVSGLPGGGVGGWWLSGEKEKTFSTSPNPSYSFSPLRSQFVQKHSFPALVIARLHPVLALTEMSFIVLLWLVLAVSVARSSVFPLRVNKF